MDDFRIAPVRTRQRTKSFPFHTLVFICGSCLIIVLSIWAGISIFRTASPSEKNAQQQRDAVAKAGNNPFAGLASAWIPKGSLDVQISGQPTLNISQNRLELEITNRSDEAIAWLQGNFEFIQKERTVPYCNGTFFREFPGGIEPGESLNIQCNVYEVEFQEATEERLKNGAFWHIYINNVITGQDEIYTSSQQAVKLKVGKN